MANDEKSDAGGAGDDDPSVGSWGATRLPPQPPDDPTRQRREGNGMLVETLEIKKDEAFELWRESFNQKIWTNEMKKEPVLALIDADVQVIGGEDFAEIVSNWLGRNVTNNNLDESDTKEYLENHAVYSRPEKLNNRSQSWIFISHKCSITSTTPNHISSHQQESQMPFFHTKERTSNTTSTRPLRGIFLLYN